MPTDQLDETSFAFYRAMCQLAGQSTTPSNRILLTGTRDLDLYNLEMEPWIGMEFRQGGRVLIGGPTYTISPGIAADIIRLFRGLPTVGGARHE